MLPEEERITRILTQTPEPLFPSDIAEEMNKKTPTTSPSLTLVDVCRRLLTMQAVTELQDGRWALKRFLL